MASHNEHDDLLLARVLQEQERAFHAMLMASIAPTNKNSSRECQQQQQQQQQQQSAEGLSDEELARQLQEQEDEEAFEEGQAHAAEFDAEVDYDRLSYEEFNALGDVAGSVSRGLSADILQHLPRTTANQHMQRQQCSCKDADTRQSSAEAAGASAKQCSCGEASSMCVVCQCEFEGGDEVLKLLPGCGHVYHEACIDQWLSASKDCPICHKEVTLPKNSA